MNPTRRRVLLDSNVYISYMLKAHPEGAVVKAVQCALSKDFTLLLPLDLIAEVVGSVRRKKSLRGRLRAEDVEELMAALSMVAETIDTMGSVSPLPLRDPDDNFVLACAVFGDADYLVSGDRDLLTIGHVGRLWIVSPQEFAELATQADL